MLKFKTHQFQIVTRRYIPPKSTLHTPHSTLSLLLLKHCALPSNRAKAQDPFNLCNSLQ